MDSFDVRNNNCSICGEEIGYGSRRCPYCGSLLNGNNNSQNSGLNEGLDIPISDSTQSYVEPVPAEPDNQQQSVNQDAAYKNSEIEYQVRQTDQYINQGVLNTGTQNDSVKTQTIDYNNMGNRSDVVNSYGYQGKNPPLKPLGNGIKVFLTVISTIPWIGQLAGIIAAIIYMNSEDDKDRKSFGLALLVSSLTLFVVISCLGCLIAMIAS